MNSTLLWGCAFAFLAAVLLIGGFMIFHHA